MREIKFRAYRKTKGNYHKIGEFTLEEVLDEIVTQEPEWTFINDGTLIKVQFTGLHDKNGKEIYEGDIVEVHRLGSKKFKPIIGEVVWYASYGSVGFHLKQLKPEEDTSDWDLYDEMGSNFNFSKDLTVIGNIYEKEVKHE